MVCVSLFKSLLSSLLNWGQSEIFVVLLVCVLMGDIWVFVEFYVLVCVWLCWIVLVSGVVLYDVDDILQESLFKIWCNVGWFDFVCVLVMVWMFMIVCNMIIDYLCS